MTLDWFWSCFGFTGSSNLFDFLGFLFSHIMKLLKKAVKPFSVCLSSSLSIVIFWRVSSWLNSNITGTAEVLLGFLSTSSSIKPSYSSSGSKSDELSGFTGPFTFYNDFLRFLLVIGASASLLFWVFFFLPAFFFFNSYVYSPLSFERISDKAWLIRFLLWNEFMLLTGRGTLSPFWFDFVLTS